MLDRTTTARLSCAVLMVAGAVSSVIAAPAAVSAQAGRDLFTRSCTSCHAMEDASTASDHAPPLSSLARANRERPGAVRAWLTNPHPPMPNLGLSRREITDLIAYLNSIPAS